jgi:VWFA-related protein
MTRRVCRWTSLLLLLAGTATAQQNPATPTFRAGARLVEVDVIARTKDGPATGLMQDDFTVLDNGRPQKISLFSIKASQASTTTPASSSAPASVPASRPLPPGAVSNRLTRDGEASTNVTALLIDQRNTPQTDQGFALQRIVKFIGMRRSKDRVALYTFGRDGLQRVQDLTDDAELLSRAANRVKAHDPGHICGSDLQGRAAEECSRSEVLARMLDTKHALEGVARHLTKVPGRKNLIWITSSFPIMGRDFDFTPDMEDAARVLNEAKLTLYAVDARGLIGALSGMTALSNAESRGNPQAAQMNARKLGVGPSGIETMNLLAGRTGGEVYFNSNGIEDSIQTAVEDGELTYTLGFYPTQEGQDGLWHKLKVEVARQGVKVRYRQNYFAGPAEQAANERPTLQQLFQDPLDATQLEVLAEPAPDPERRGFVQVKVTVDPHNLEWKREDGRRSGGVDVSFSVEGSTKWLTKTSKFGVPEEQFAAFLEKGIVTVESIDTAGGVEALRVVVQDRTTGAAGSVRVPLVKK